jgi:phenylpropionate dioxygenase-like ring-hydroxylating dioxygenase large terminal subunit
MGKDAMAETTAASGLSYSLPKSYYTAPEVFAAEKERIFYRSWVCVGLLEDAREPGEYFTAAVADQDILVIRGRDGELRAFYNLRRIVCPYHAWSYDLDGRLAYARNSESVPGFDASAICLTPVRVEAFCHLVFVNLDPDAPSLGEQIEGLEAEVRAVAPEIDQVCLGDRVEKVIEANWKVIVENFSECYHCTVAHPSFTQGVVDPESYRITPHRYYQRHSCAAQPAGRSQYEFDRQASAHAEAFHSWYIWPSMALQIYPGGAVNSFRWQPLGEGRTRVVNDWFFAVLPPSHAERKLVHQHRATTFPEDFPLVEAVQRGILSRGYERGPVMVDRVPSSLSEIGVRAFQDLVRDAPGDL